MNITVANKVKRNVALMDECNKHCNNNKEQEKFLLSVIQGYQQQYSN